eukprot:COSAG02_NODE_401_length_23083_cov_26.955839_8_plen_94_part_00
MEVALERQKRKQLQRELAKLVRKRDSAVAGSRAYQQLNQQIKELRQQLKPPDEPAQPQPVRPSHRTPRAILVVKWTPAVHFCTLEHYVYIRMY